MISRCVSFLWLLAVYVQGFPHVSYIAEFELKIEEKGVEFKETVRTDIINNVVYYHTPAHNDLIEMYRIQDFNQNLEVSCLPLRSECLMSKLDRKQYLDASKMTQNLVQGYKQNRNKIIDEKSMVEVTNRKYKTGRMIDVSLILSRPIQEFVAQFNFTIYEVELVPEDAIILEDNTVNPTVNERQKRQDVGVFPDCENDKAPRRKYGYANTAECDYLTFCAGAVCNQSHVRDRIYYTCLCCPEHTRVRECLYCSKLF